MLQSKTIFFRINGKKNFCSFFFFQLLEILLKTYNLENMASGKNIYSKTKTGLAINSLI